MHTLAYCIDPRKRAHIQVIVQEVHHELESVGAFVHAQARRDNRGHRLLEVLNGVRLPCHPLCHAALPNAKH